MKEQISPTGIEKPIDQKQELNKEIEKKFKVKQLPKNLENYPHKNIEQGYISGINDEIEVRLRKEGEEEKARYSLTVKRGIGEMREEVKIEDLTEEQYKIFFPLTERKRLAKTRYEIDNGDDQIIELDVYKGPLKGFLSAEVEFKNLTDSKKFVPPEWFGENVTGKEGYSNQELAYNGLPKTEIEKAKTEINHEKLDIPEYDLESGVAELVRSVKEKMSEKDGTIIVEIAGGSASGKTSAVAAKLKEALGDDAFILSMDNYYRGGQYVKDEAKKGNVLNFDQPEALNLDLLSKHLQLLKEGKPAPKLEFHFNDNPPETVGELEPKKVIILEGLFSLNDSLKDQGDVKAFVDIGTHGRVLRRMLRDVNRTGQKPKDILKYFSEIVEPMQEKYIDSTKKNADMLIKNEYNPQVEAERAGMQEIQMKFKFDIDEEKKNILRALGFHRLVGTSQTDKYYNPKDRNLSETGESLRIREEGSDRTLTYKGPKVESEFRKRPKFEFEIDKDTEKSFLTMYGDNCKTIIKNRTMYQKGPITLSLDKVYRENKDSIVDLGEFLEIRLADDKTSKKEIESLLEALHLNFSDGTKESYGEM